MGEKSNLTIRISTDLKVQAEAAALFLDTTLSQVARDAFREMIVKAGQKALQEQNFKANFAQLGIEAPPMTRREQVDFEEYGMDTRKLSKTQRAAVRRGVRSGRIEKPESTAVRPAGQARLSMKEEVIASIRQRAADGLLTQEEANEKIWRMENPSNV